MLIFSSSTIYLTDLMNSDLHLAIVSFDMIKEINNLIYFLDQ